MKIYDLSINGAADLNAIPIEGLRFSWKIKSAKANVFQKNYHIIITADNGDVAFDSGLVNSGKSVEVSPDGLKLLPETSYTAEVNVETTDGDKALAKISFYTEVKDFGAAKWIKPADKVEGWAPFLRTKFRVRRKPKRVMVSCSALGVGELYINGEKPFEIFLDPPATNYNKVILYRTFDLTNYVNKGKNCLAFLVGQGFYAQNRVWGINDMKYGDECLIAKIVVEYSNGERDVFVSDETWKTRKSALTINNIYAGEIYDARLEFDGFADALNPDDGWSNVVIDNTPKGELKGCMIPPVKIIDKVPCVKVQTSSGLNDGAWVFDMGENFAGIYEVKIPESPAGATYVFRTTENANQDGSIDMRSIGAYATQCIQQEIYIAKGTKGGEYYRPRFCYHSFRFVEMSGMHDMSEGYGTVPKPEMITGIKLSTDLCEKGSFECDNKDLNRFDYLMRNTYRSNYHGYPEDCPGREKCGWLGDAALCCNWGILNYDMTAAYTKYLMDIRTSYETFGTWQMIAPGKRTCGNASPLWGAAQIEIPYYLWKYNGYADAVKDNIDLMRKWVKHEVEISDNYIISEGLGDWDPCGGNNSVRKMPVKHSSSLMLFEIATQMAEISKAFGYGDEKYYLDIAEKTKKAIIDNFYDKDAHTYGFWGSNGAALKLGCYPENDGGNLLKATLELMKRENYAMPTGIYGNKYLVPALIENGCGEHAIKMLFNRDEKSFGTMMDDGATTVWECADMEFTQPRDKETSSYSHPMHGGFLYSCFTDIAGIAPITPGFEKFAIEPKLVDGINNLCCEYESVYGKIAVSLKKTKKTLVLKIEIPCNTTCVVKLPGIDSQEYGSGKHSIKINL